MDRIQIGLKIAMDELGIQIEKTPYSTIRNIVYLAIAKGVYLTNSSFCWSSEGNVISRSLFEDIGTIKNELNQGYDDSKSWCLDNNSKKRLKNLGPLITSTSDLEKELLASVHFLTKKVKKSVDEISDIFKKFNKSYSEEQILAAVETLKEQEII